MGWTRLRKAWVGIGVVVFLAALYSTLSGSRREDVTVLIAYRTAGETGVYRTVGLNLSPTGVVQIGDAPDVLFARSTGMWRTGVATTCSENPSIGSYDLQQVRWEAPVDEAPAVQKRSSVNCAGLATDTAMQQCGDDKTEILFVSARYLSEQTTQEQTEQCEPRGGRWNTSNRVVRIGNDDSLDFALLFGALAEEAYDEAAALGDADRKREGVECPEQGANDHDFRNWSIRHRRGAWRAHAEVNSSGGLCEYSHEIDWPLPDSMTDDGVRGEWWPELAAAIPSLSDYFVSPGRRFLFTITGQPNVAGRMKIAVHDLRTGLPGAKLWEAPWEGHQGPVMIQWATGKEAGPHGPHSSAGSLGRFRYAGTATNP